MNGLSWLLYLSGVVGSLNSFFIFLTCVSTVGFLGMGLGFFLTRYEALNQKQGSEDATKYASMSVAFRRAWMASLFCLVFFGVVGNLMPDRKTMMLIAASEIGERVVQNTKVQSVLDPSVDLLKTYVDKELFETRLALDKMKKAAKKALDD